MGMSGWPRNEKRELWAFVVKVDWLRRNLQECFLFRGNKREKDRYKLFATCTSVRWKHSKIRFKDRNTNLCPPSLLTSNSCMSRSRELSSTQFDQSPVTNPTVGYRGLKKNKKKLLWECRVIKRFRLLCLGWVWQQFCIHYIPPGTLLF